MKENTSENLAKERLKRLLGEGLSEEVISEVLRKRLPGSQGWK